MRRIIFLGFLLMTGWAHAQYESFFGQQTWTYDEVQPVTCYMDNYDPTLISLCCVTENFHFNRNNIVDINDTTYYCCSENSMPIYLREDTVNGRLYSRYQIDNYNREFLICDLSLSVGDTFILQNSLNNSDPFNDIIWFDLREENKMRVDSVSYYSGRKVLHLTFLSDNSGLFFTSPDYNVTLRFMEGVGPMYGILPHGRNDEEYAGVLLCLSKDEDLYYMTHEDLGCYQVGSQDVKNYPQTYLNIYPNPASGNITLDFTSENAVSGIVIIRDMIGRVCNQVNIISSKTNVISLSDLPQGVYLLTFMDESNRKLTKKIVKL